MGRERGNSEELRRALERGRAPSAGEVSQQGYADPAGVPRAVGGDDDAPWLKTPPFPSDVTRWFSANNTDDAAFDDDYVLTEPLDVTNWRLFTLWIDFRPTTQAAGVSGLLSLVPLAARQLNKVNPPATEFYPIGVVDPTLTVLDLSATIFGLSVFGSRTFSPAELRTPAVPVAEVLQATLVFDVSQYVALRFGVGAVLDQDVDATVALGYSYAE